VPVIDQGYFYFAPGMTKKHCQFGRQTAGNAFSKSD
jgi:hypothetical protein